MILAEHRREIFSKERDIRPFMPGATIADIVASFETSPDFAFRGAVMICDPARGPDGIFRVPRGIEIDRDKWHVVRPKDGAAVFVSCKLGDDDTKKTFAIIGMLALIVLAPQVAPLLGFAAGTLAASAITAGIVVGGSLAIAQLTKPSAGTPVEAPGGMGAAGPTLGQAGIAGNPIGAFVGIPDVLGTMRVSPPFLMRPFSRTEDNDEWIYFIAGMVGEKGISEIKIDKTALEDLSEDTYEIETRPGAVGDAPLTIVTGCAFQENLNLPFSTHRLEADQATLINPFLESYPKPHIFRTETRCGQFRLGLLFPSGFYDNTSGVACDVPFRARFRQVGTETWINGPEFHVRMLRRALARLEVWFSWGPNSLGSTLANEVQGQVSPFVRVYNKNPDWTANSYFGTSTTAVGLNVANTYKGKDKITFHLKTGTFPLDQYDIEITRGAAAVASQNLFNTVAYVNSLFKFTSASTSGANKKIPPQFDKQVQSVIAHITTFRDEYPILETELALICGKFKNIQINSVSALFTSKVDGVETSDPAVLLPYVLSGSLNARPFDEDLIEDLSDWSAHCTAKGLSVNALIDGMTVEQVAALIAGCGDAEIRRSDLWGVTIDRDRSAEEPVGLFTPQQMNPRLTVTKIFHNAPRVILPTFLDITKDYAVNETSGAVYDDGVPASENPFAEGVHFTGYVTEALVRRAAAIALRRKRLRSLLYSFGLGIENLGFRKGDLIAISHDILTRSYGTGRIRSFTESGGNLLTVTLNTEVLDAPAPTSGKFFATQGVFALGKLFALEGVKVGLRIRLADGDSSVVVPVTADSSATLTVDGTFPTPSRLEAGCVAAVGPRDNETRRVIVASITPQSDFRALIEAFDEAPAIFTGY